MATKNISKKTPAAKKPKGKKDKAADAEAKALRAVVDATNQVALAGLQKEAAKKTAAKPAPKAPAKKPAAKSEPAPQGGYVRPVKDAPCAQLWALFDKLQAKKPKGQFVLVGEAKAVAAKHELNSTTCTIQFYHWRRSLGVRGRGSKQKVG